MTPRYGWGEYALKRLMEAPEVGKRVLAALERCSAILVMRDDDEKIVIEKVEDE